MYETYLGPITGHLLHECDKLELVRRVQAALDDGGGPQEFFEEIPDLEEELRAEKDSLKVATAELTTYRAALIDWLEAVKCPTMAPPNCKCPRCTASQSVDLWAPVN